MPIDKGVLRLEIPVGDIKNMHPCKSAQELVGVKFDFCHRHALSIAYIVTINLICVFRIVVHYNIKVIAVVLVVGYAIVVVARLNEEVVRVQVQDDL